MIRTVLALAGIALCASAGSAHADTRAKLFPLSASGLPKSLKGAPAELTRVLARSLGAETTSVPIEDAAEMIECSLTEKKCLESIASSVGVKKIIFGRIERKGDGAMVKLTMFDSDKGESERSIAISGDTVDAMSDSLRDAVEGASKGEGKEIDPPTTPETPIDTDPVPPPATGGVTTGTWAMLIGGGIGVAAGGGFLLSARSLAVQVASAPDDTLTDIQRIQAMEKAGAARAKIGYGLIAAGGVVATIGVIRYIAQKKSSPGKAPEQPRFDVVPESGGASVRFTMGWR